MLFFFNPVHTQGGGAKKIVHFEDGRHFWAVLIGGFFTFFSTSFFPPSMLLDSVS
jgi:hypothetical protein